ncbi:unnamed protein product [Schistosoma turkestanicum]|nr:unnamed protein product [Schistosoma turkestanicum]
MKQDNTKIKELDLELEKLTNVRKTLKTKLDTTYTNTLVNQVKFDNLSKEVKEAYTQRDSLIKQWEDVINQMRQRDVELEHFSQRLNQAKAQVCEQKQLNKEKLDFLHLQEENNLNVRQKLNEIIKNITQCKQDLSNTETKRLDFHSGLEALKRTVDKTVNDLEAARVLNSQLKKEKEKKLQNLENLQESIDSSLTRLSYVTECKLTAEQYADEADKQLTSQTLNHELFCKQLNKLREEKFKVTQKYEDFVREEKLLKQAISGCEITKRNLLEKIETLDSQLIKQQEVLYRQDFTIQSLERRIGRMSGDESNDQRELLENKIAELTKELNERENTVAMLTNQLGNLGGELHRIKRECETLLNKNESLQNQLDTNELEIDIMLKEKEKQSLNLQKLLVEKNLKKLEVHRLTKIYEQYTDKRYDLQKASQELNSTVKERTEQINLHQTMLNKQIKINATENSQLNIEIQDRKSKVDKLIKRYEIITALMAPPEGEETKSLAYYLIKAAQDKELLRRKGDTLDNEIHILEQEIVALENTLALMNGCNTVYRMSHAQLTNDADEIQQQTELNEQIRVLNIKSRYDQSRLNELHDLYNKMEESSTRLDNDIELYKDQTKRLEVEVEHRTNEIEKQNTRLKRASERMEKVKRLIKKEDQENMRPDIEARLAKELVTLATNELLDRLKGDVTIYEQARVMLSTSGIPVNSLAGVSGQKRRVSGLSSSTKSVISSCRTTPTPIGSEPTSPDSTKCSSKICSPPSGSVCSGDDAVVDEYDNVQNSSRCSGGNTTKDM